MFHAPEIRGWNSTKFRKLTSMLFLCFVSSQRRPKLSVTFFRGDH